MKKYSGIKFKGFFVKKKFSKKRKLKTVKAEASCFLTEVSHKVTTIQNIEKFPSLFVQPYVVTSSEISRNHEIYYIFF